VDECWQSIARQLDFDLHGNTVHYVKAKQIKDIANKEPRLMAKIDTREKLPEIFRKYGAVKSCYCNSSDTACISYFDRERKRLWQLD
jgi:hypothetical protein